MKTLKCSEFIAYKIKKEGFRQSNHTACFSCSQPFKTCPHSLTQIDELIGAARIGIALGIYAGKKP